MTIQEIKVMLKNGIAIETIHLSHGGNVGCPMCYGMTSEEAAKMDEQIRNGDLEEVR